VERELIHSLYVFGETAKRPDSYHSKSNPYKINDMRKPAKNNYPVNMLVEQRWSPRVFSEKPIKKETVFGRYGFLWGF
jgi:hypothetical protein